MPDPMDVNVNAQDIVSALQNSVIAINNLNQTIADVLPQIVGTSASAGAFSGLYLEIIVSGTTYKIQLLNEA